VAIDPDRARHEANWARYRPGQQEGHYESWFQRANHPARPLAFWIRYTLFSPARRPGEAMGELWAIFFDGESGRHTAVKEELPFQHCSFARDRFEVLIGDARLDGQGLRGSAASRGHRASWELGYSGAGAPPLFFFPLPYYERSLPRAKVLANVPDALYRGFIEIDGRKIEVDGWRGTQNHNWGERHTDLYAWGQVAGFDEAPDSYLEVATARLKVGPLWTPRLTSLVLRHRGEEFALNSAYRALRAEGGFQYFDWHFRSGNDAVRVEGRMHAPASAFVALPYANPPGGTKHCLNSKLAACELRITRRGAEGRTEHLTTLHRAAFEILTDDHGHGIPLGV
jgi:hypothetical protein